MGSTAPANTRKEADMTSPRYAHPYDQFSALRIRNDVLAVFSERANCHTFDLEYRPLDLFTLRRTDHALFKQAWNDIRDTFELAYGALDNATTATRLRVARRVLDIVDEQCAQALWQPQDERATVVLAIPRTVDTRVYEEDVVVLHAPDHAPRGPELASWLPGVASDRLNLRECLYLTDTTGSSAYISGTNDNGEVQTYRLLVKTVW